MYAHTFSYLSYPSTVLNSFAFALILSDMSLLSHIHSSVPLLVGRGDRRHLPRVPPSTGWSARAGSAAAASCDSPVYGDRRHPPPDRLNGRRAGRAGPAVADYVSSAGRRRVVRSSFPGSSAALPPPAVADAHRGRALPRSGRAIPPACRTARARHRFGARPSRDLAHRTFLPSRPARLSASGCPGLLRSSRFGGRRHPPPGPRSGRRTGQAARRPLAPPHGKRPPPSAGPALQGLLLVVRAGGASARPHRIHGPQRPLAAGPAPRVWLVVRAGTTGRGAPLPAAPAGPALQVAGTVRSSAQAAPAPFRATELV